MHTPDRIVTYLATVTALLDLVVVAVFNFLPTLQIDPESRNTLSDIVVYLGVCLPVFSSLLVFMLLVPFNSKTVRLRILRFISGAVLMLYSILVCGIVVHTFRGGM